jgi:hypothetical protein
MQERRSLLDAWNLIITFAILMQTRLNRLSQGRHTAVHTWVGPRDGASLGERVGPVLGDKLGVVVGRVVGSRLGSRVGRSLRVGRR